MNLVQRNAWILILMVNLFACGCLGVWAGDYEITSPDQQIQVRIEVGDQILYSITKAGQPILAPSLIGMELQDGTVLGTNATVEDTQQTSVDQVFTPVVKIKCAQIPERFNQLQLNFKEPFSLIFRVYDEGVAYRIETNLPGSIVVKNEQVQFNFAGDPAIDITHEKSLHSSHETPYIHSKISEVAKGELCSLPGLISLDNGRKALITESDLDDYPGLWLHGSGAAQLTGFFPPYPAEEAPNRDIKKRADYIAQTEGTRAFPWRVVLIADEDKDLITNQLVLLLAKPCAIEDPSWIKPGQVILDWWGRRNIFGVDFKAGVNTATIKYFIDFCHTFGIRYFLMDEGWSTHEDLLKINPDVDMDTVTAYAKEKNVDLILWVYWTGLDKQMEKTLDQFAQWGVKGIKVDFMDRDDQRMVRFFHRVAREAAQRKMVVNFHGAYKPAGLEGKYPNVLTREGFIEFEYNGWTDLANPEHHMTLPFTRMVCGPLDYIPCTFFNTQKHEFRPVGDRPMGLGTRAHSIALAVLLESPMQMIPDSPSDYYREPECTAFISKIPADWDETVVLQAQVSDYLILARRKGEVWYMAAATDWTPRDFTLEFPFLGEDTYTADVISDGINADIRAIDYKRAEITLRRDSQIPIQLAPGGGWVARIEKK